MLSSVNYRISKVRLCQSQTSVSHLNFYILTLVSLYLLYIQNVNWVKNNFFFLIFYRKRGSERLNNENFEKETELKDF